MMFRKNNGGDVFDAIQSDVFTALEQLGEDQADAWRQRVAIPVDYLIGPRGGITVVRSRPGEPPRRETGVMQESIQSAVETDATLVILTVDSDVDYAAYLDAGTARIAPRPHAPDLDEFIEQALDAIVAAIEG